MDRGKYGSAGKMDEEIWTGGKWMGKFGLAENSDQEIRIGRNGSVQKKGTGRGQVARVVEVMVRCGEIQTLCIFYHLV